MTRLRLGLSTGVIAAGLVLAGCAGGGRVQLDCGVAPGGAITDCRILSETPPGEGYGLAALQAARTARLSPQAQRNPPATGRVLFNMKMKPEDRRTPQS
jgi:TonB family protein